METQQPTIALSENIHAIKTRSKVGIYKPRVFLTTDLSTFEPTIVQEALQSPPWKAVMQEEYDALIANHTWSLVP